MDKQLPPLTLPEAEMRHMAEQVFDLIVDHFSTLETLPVTKPSTLENITDGLQEPLPDLLPKFSPVVSRDLQGYISA